MAKMFILAVFCVCFISVSFAQNLEPKFIVTIGDYDPPRVSIGKGISKCYATALSDRYVVTTASCVKSIQKLTSVSLFSVSGAAVVSQQVSSFRSFIHPNFTEAKPYENNVALITVSKIIIVTRE
jgi:secreted trypsin-like serine protease